MTLLLLCATLACYIVAIVVAMLWRRHYRRFECIRCRNRRRIIRVATLMIIAVLILVEGRLHWPDLGFLGWHC